MPGTGLPIREVRLVVWWNAQRPHVHYFLHRCNYTTSHGISLVQHPLAAQGWQLQHEIIQLVGGQELAATHAGRHVQVWAQLPSRGLLLIYYGFNCLYDAIWRAIVWGRAHWAYYPWRFLFLYVL